MKTDPWRTPKRFCLIVSLGLFCAPIPGVSAGDPQQPQKPAPEGSTQKGTGAIPPGVKLVPQMPAGAAPQPFRFPKAVERTLPNGLRVFVVSDSEQPAVTVRLVLTAAGSIHDPTGRTTKLKPGVAAMTANLLTQGTTKRSAQQIAEAIDFVGGTLSASADSDATYVTATVVKKDLDLGMDLLSDVVLNASFQNEELDRRREQLLSGLQIQYADADYLASVIFNRVVYAQHPYGLPNEGTPESVRQLQRDDLVRFRDTYYLPNHALLAFAGDITPEAAFAAAEKYLGSWPRTEFPSAKLPPISPAQGRRIFLVDKPDAVQTQIRIGRPGIRRNDPDYLPLLVTNRIFGGGFNSRLSTEVRIRKGLTYGAYSQFDSRKHAGSFVAATFTRTEATVEATRLVVDLIGKMASGAATKVELDFARDYLAGVFPIQSETPEQVAGRILNVAHYDLPADYNDTYREKILAVGPEQVQATARRYFSSCESRTPQRDADCSLDLVLVGNVKEFGDALKKEFSEAKVEEISFDQVNLLAADLRQPKEAAAPANPEALARGAAILAAAAEATAGPEASAALAKIESLAFMTTGMVFTPQGESPLDVKLQIAFPDRLWMDVNLPFGAIQQGYDGKSGWVASPQGTLDLPATQTAQARRGIDLVGGLGLYRQALAGKLEAQFVGEEELEAKKVLAVEWLATAGKVKLYFDPGTRLLVGARYRQNTLEGAFDTEQRWSDFRLVDGIRFPFRWVTYRDGAKFTDQTVQEVKLNIKVDSALFAKPK